MTRKILLVDDDTDDHFFFANALRELDASLQCVIVENGQQAIEYLGVDDEFPAMIFLDLNMPLMNGFECLQELKTNERLKKIPVTIFTTSASEADRERTLGLGAEHFLTKTMDYRDFKSGIREILTHYI